MIDRYYIDENNVLHTFKGDEKYITFDYITSDEQAQTSTTRALQLDM